MTNRALPMSKAKIVWGSAFIVFVVATIVILVGFQSNFRSYADTDGKTQFESEVIMPLTYPLDDFDKSANLEMDSTIGISDFGRRLDDVDERLASMEQSVSQLRDELSSYKGVESQVSQSLASELQSLKSRIAQLATADNTLGNSLDHIKVLLRRLETQRQSDTQNELPVAGLKLLSVSIWDDGAVAIVSLGKRKTGLSVGNFFAGLKVEDISVAEQSLTLYEPAANKLYTLYADAIVYKEADAQ